MMKKRWRSASPIRTVRTYKQRLLPRFSFHHHLHFRVFNCEQVAPAELLFTFYPHPKFPTSPNTDLQRCLPRHLSPPSKFQCPHRAPTTPTYVPPPILPTLSIITAAIPMTGSSEVSASRIKSAMASTSSKVISVRRVEWQRPISTFQKREERPICKHMHGPPTTTRQRRVVKRLIGQYLLSRFWPLARCSSDLISLQRMGEDCFRNPSHYLPREQALHVTRDVFMAYDSYDLWFMTCLFGSSAFS